MNRIRGVGIGLRAALTEHVLGHAPPELEWLEITPENYLRRGGRFRAALEACALRWPLVTHGLTLSLGGTDPFRRSYLEDLAAFVRDVGSPWHSDHLSFSVVGGAVLHELLPLPFTRRAAAHVATRIRQAEDALGVPLAVENITSYVAAPGSDMDEGDFIAEVVQAADCLLLLDVNNMYVNGQNHGFDPRELIAKLPLERVVEIHVAGHDATDPRLLVDTHAEPIREHVYQLLAWTLERTGPVPVLLERDDNFPPWEELCLEIGRLSAILQAAERRRGGEAA